MGPGMFDNQKVNMEHSRQLVCFNTMKFNHIRNRMYMRMFAKSRCCLWHSS